MSDIYKAVNKLLSAFVNDTTPLPVENIDWNKLYIISKQHNIDAVLGYMVSRNDICNDPVALENFKKSYITAIMVSTNKVLNFSQLQKKLCDNDIDLVVFKGYVLRSLYPVEDLRTFSDIDALIHPYDKEKSHKLMLQWGYKAKVDFGSVYSYKSGLEYYELHDSILDEDIFHNKRTLDYFLNAWEHTIKVSDRLYKFDDTFHLLFLIAHIAKHIRYGGAGIRMYLDIAFFIKKHRDSFDFANLLNTAKELCIEKFTAIVLYCSCKWFDIDIPTEIEKNISNEDIKTANELYNYTMDRGLFGNTKQTTGQATVEMMSSDGKKMPRLSAFLRITVPPLSVMKLRYHYLNKVPFLLPFAWIQRVFDNKDKLAVKKRKLEDIVATDTAELTQHQNMLDNLGL